MPNRDEKIVKLHDVNANRRVSTDPASPESASILHETDHQNRESALDDRTPSQKNTPDSAPGHAGTSSADSTASVGQGNPSKVQIHNTAAADGESWGKKAPNILTVMRILAVPFFVFLLTDPSPQSRLWATAIFLLASFTDWLDGYLARIYKAESILGTLLDPLADKVLVTAALVMLAAEGGELRVPAWLVVIILARDLLVSGLRSLAAVQGIVVAASRAAKHKTAWTMVAIVFLLVGQTYQIYGTEVNFHVVGMIVLWGAVVLSVASGLDYAIKLRRVFL